MDFSIHNRRLLSGMMAGAVALAAASACSRSDRASAGRDSTQTGAAVVPADSQAGASTSAPAQPNTATQPSTGTQPSSTDTAAAAPSVGNDNAASQTPKAGHRHRRPRSSVTRAPSASAPDTNADQGVAGYQAMGRDSSTASSGANDSAQVSASAAQPADTSSVASVSDTNQSADTTATEMAGAAQAQADTSSQAQADTATIGDTGVILTHADTTQQSEVAVANDQDTMAADTAAVVSDSASAQRIHSDTVSQKAAELAKHEPTRVRPPEDSTELHGKVTTDGSAANADAAAVGAAGVASTGNIATGADAVALVSRQGESCVVPAPDQNRDVLWDMANSPSSLNPCGTGTMTLPRIWTGEKK